MLKKLFLAFAAGCWLATTGGFGGPALAAPDEDDDGFDESPFGFPDEEDEVPADKTVVVETPVSSYSARVDDVNFVPEAEFMRRGQEQMNFDLNIEMARRAEAAAVPGIQFAQKPVVVCRDHGCTRLNDRITQTFLFNSLSNMFILNSRSRLNICEADPFARACLQGGISFAARAGIASALIKIPRATINNVGVTTGLSRASIGMTYEFMVNGIGVRCEPTVAEIEIPGDANAMLVSREFSCAMTADGPTNVSLLINLDYIDLDYGILGGYYSFGLQGPTTGGGKGYALFKMEFSKRGGGYAAGAAAKQDRNAALTIRPGEYAVEPLEK